MSRIADNCLVTTGGSSAYPAYVEPANTTWNGFVCPTFTATVAQWIGEDMNRQADEDPATAPRFIWNGSVLTISDPYDDDLVWDFSVEPRAAIGAGVWTWSIVRWLDGSAPPSSAEAEPVEGESVTSGRRTG